MPAGSRRPRRSADPANESPKELRDQRWQARAAGPLSADEWAEHLGQQERIRAAAGLAQKTLLIDHDLGRVCEEARKTGFWLRDPEHAGKDFVEYCIFVFGQAGYLEPSRQTVARRMVIARVFSREQVEEYARRGLCITTLSDIAWAEAHLRPRLLNLAKNGASHAKILAAIQAARRAARPARQAAAPANQGQGQRTSPETTGSPGTRQESEAVATNEDAKATAVAATDERERVLREREEQVVRLQEAIDQERQALQGREEQVAQREQILVAREQHAEERDQALDDRETECERKRALLKQMQTELEKRDATYWVPEAPHNIEETLSCMQKTARKLSSLSRVLHRQRREETGRYLGPRSGEVLYEAKRQLNLAAARCEIGLFRLSRAFWRMHPELSDKEEDSFHAWQLALVARVEARCRPAALEQTMSNDGQNSKGKLAANQRRPVTAPR